MTLVMHLCSPRNRRTINFYDDDYDDVTIKLHKLDECWKSEEQAATHQREVNDKAQCHDPTGNYRR